MLCITGVCPARAGDIAQRFPDVLLVDSRIEKIVHPAQRVHSVSDVVQPTLRPVITQRPVDAFGSQYFTEMSHVVFPGRRDTSTNEMLCVGMQKLLGHSIGPVLRA
jgi:hypothetical protein